MKKEELFKKLEEWKLLWKIRRDFVTKSSEKVYTHDMDLQKSLAEKEDQLRKELKKFPEFVAELTPEERKETMK